MSCRFSLCLVLPLLVGCGLPEMTDVGDIDDPPDEVHEDAADDDDVADDPEDELPQDDDDAVDDVPDPPELGPLPPLGQRRCDGMLPMTMTDPTQLGPHPVGVRTLVFEDDLRGGRSLTTEIWYPADPSTSGPGVGYGVGLDDLAGLAGDDLGGLLALLALAGDGGDIMTIVETDAVRDALPAEPDPARGLVLFSHGFRGARYQSTFLTVWLASHGWVVAAPDHVGNTMFDGSEEAADSAISRIFDLYFLTDAMEQLVDDPADPLYEAFDPQRVATVGHSFGASTTLSGGVMDNREMVAIPLAPAFDDRMAAVWNPESYDLRAAVSIIGGSADGSTPWSNQQMAWDHTVAPRFLTQLDGARHFDFTDLCANDLLRFALTSFVEQLSDACGEDPTAYHATIKTSVTATLGRYLACDPAADAWLQDDFVTGLEHVSVWESDPAGAIADGLPEPPEIVLLPESVPTAILDGDGATLTLYGEPTAGPTVVFLPGALLDGRIFAGQVDALSPSGSVGVVDLPGAPALGPAAPDALDETAAVDALASVLEQTTGSVVLVGVGRGGRIAMRYALSAGPEIAGLVLVGTAPLALPDWMNVPDYNGGETLQWSSAVGRAVAGDDWGVVASAMLPAGTEPARVALLAALIDEVPAATRAGILTAEDPSLLDDIAAIEVPVLLLHGEHDDVALLESTTWLEQALPDAQSTVFQRSGHLPFVDEPEAFAYEVAAFVSGL